MKSKTIKLSDLSSEEIFKMLINYNTHISYSLENKENMPIKETVEDMKRTNTYLLNGYHKQLMKEKADLTHKLKILYGKEDK